MITIALVLSDVWSLRNMSHGMFVGSVMLGAAELIAELVLLARVLS